jgi:hypothetical protein
MTARRKTSSTERLLKTQIAVYLEPAQAVGLKELSLRTRRAQQVYVREGVDYVLAKYKGAKS